MLNRISAYNSANRANELKNKSKSPSFTAAYKFANYLDEWASADVMSDISKKISATGKKSFGFYDEKTSSYFLVCERAIDEFVDGIIKPLEEIKIKIRNKGETKMYEKLEREDVDVFNDSPYKEKNLSYPLLTFDPDYEFSVHDRFYTEDVVRNIFKP